jgi:acyl-coenzyme A synthetase/AMP-(fatty) acid ligase
MRTIKLTENDLVEFAMGIINSRDFDTINEIDNDEDKIRELISRRAESYMKPVLTMEYDEDTGYYLVFGRGDKAIASFCDKDEAMEYVNSH